MSYNLLDEKWIPVLTIRGDAKPCSPLEAFGGGAGIRRVVSPSPLDVFAAHRFLLTLLYWKADDFGGVEAVGASLLAGRVPTGLLEALRSESRNFELFDAKKPYLQDMTLAAKVGELKSAGSFFAECACGTNTAHFSHSRDSDVCLCHACAARGLVRVVPWTQSGGAGLTPSVHNAPPIMVLALGKNLTETLGLNLVPLDCGRGEPQWTGHFKPTNPGKAVPYMEAFTWNPRRIRLITMPTPAVCWMCGSPSAEPVTGLLFEKNPATASNKAGGKTVPFPWQDPSAFYSTEKPHITTKSGDEFRASIGADVLALWPKEGTRKATVVEHNRGHRDWQLIVPCTNPANNKSFDHRLIELHSAFSDAKDKLDIEDVLPLARMKMAGWEYPRLNGRLGGANALVRAARTLNAGDWQLLRDARWKAMNESVGAFDVFSGLYWSLRRPGKVLPTRETAWLILKVMAAVPEQWRFKKGAVCDPLEEIADRQLEPGNGYPLGFPPDDQLEEMLHRLVDHGLSHKPKRFFDWARLCAGIDALKTG